MTHDVFGETKIDIDVDKIKIKNAPAVTVEHFLARQCQVD